MTVRPTQPGLTSRTDIARTGKTPTQVSGPVSPQASSAAPAVGGRADQLEISEEARALQASDTAEQVASGAVSNERMLELSRRVAAGHYDRPEIVDEVIQRLLSDL